MVLFSSQRERAISRTCPIDHADVLVRVRDAVNIEEPRRDQSSGTGRSRWRPFAQQFDVQAALLLGFANRRLFGIFIQFDVASERQPLVELAVMDEKNLAVLNDKNSHGEIDFLVDVGHGLVLPFSNRTNRYRVNIRPSLHPGRLRCPLRLP